MSWAETPKMLVQEPIAVNFDHRSHALRQVLVGVHVKENGACIPY